MGVISALNCAGTVCTDTFTYTGGVQTWVVPIGVIQANFDVAGAAGGSEGTAGQPVGGLGGQAEGILGVIPGDTYFVYVGGAGTNGNATGTGVTNPVGGFNGGAPGGQLGSGNFGASGGGASDIRLGGTALSFRLLVAGGGGGSSSNDGNGGAGGGLTGAAGAGEAATDGTGATQSAPGAAGAGGGASGTAGTSGTGGAGAASFGGGGGGGYFGGGGGGFDSSSTDYGSGGGGSGFAASSVSDVTYSSGAQTGNGQVVITWVNDDFYLAGAPADVTAAATSSAGAVVSYTPPVVEDPQNATPPAATCSTPSGSTFPVGVTTVTCTASDPSEADSPVSDSFTVTVTDSTIDGATTVHTGEPWAGSRPAEMAVLLLGLGLVSVGEVRRRRRKSHAQAFAPGSDQ